MTELFVPTAEEMERARQEAPFSFVYVPDGTEHGRPLSLAVRANTDVSFREANVAANIVKPYKRFLQRPDLMGIRGEPLAIVGGGPSVKKHLDDIRKFKWVMAAGSSHDFLMRNGIMPAFAVSTDSKEETGDYYRELNGGTQYLMASVSPPSMLERMAEGSCRLYLWHFSEQVDPPHYRGERAIGWGCMVGVVCIQMALWLGFQEHHYFGYDCSLDRDAFETHAYAVSAEERAGIWETATEAMVGDEKTRFLTTTALIAQAVHFFAIYRCPDGQYLRGYVYGPGMLHDQIRQSPPEMREWLIAV